MPNLKSGDVLLGIGYDKAGIEITELARSMDYGNNPVKISHWCGGTLGNKVEKIYDTDSAIIRFFTGQTICRTCCALYGNWEDPHSTIIHKSKVAMQG